MKDGYFVFSLDFELIWGTLDVAGLEGFRRQCEREREAVVGRLLDLLAEFRVPATWFVVGHLMLDRCSAVDGVKHPEIVRPRHRWAHGDWFQHDPATSEPQAPLFYARGLVERIRACPTPQEIGCHSFSHVIFGDPGCSPEAAESDLAACVASAGALGLRPRSFAFPRNAVGHLDRLPRHGFHCFRGPEPVWYERWPGWSRRAAHLGEVLTQARPPVVRPRRVAPGLWDIPGSMVYLPRHGVRRLIPVSFRVRRAVKGLEAARRGGIFHLWTHPTNLVDDEDAMFDGLRRIFERAAALREAGDIRFATVGQIAEEAMRLEPTA